jgi:hypothetical protein
LLMMLRRENLWSPRRPQDDKVVCKTSRNKYLEPATDLIDAGISFCHYGAPVMLGAGPPGETYQPEVVNHHLRDSRFVVMR